VGSSVLAESNRQDSKGSAPPVGYRDFWPGDTRSIDCGPPSLLGGGR